MIRADQVTLGHGLLRLNSRVDTSLLFGQCGHGTGDREMRWEEKRGSARLAPVPVISCLSVHIRHMRAPLDAAIKLYRCTYKATSRLNGSHTVATVATQSSGCMARERWGLWKGTWKEGSRKCPGRI